MNYKLVTACVLLLAALVLAAGCVGTDNPSPTVTPTPTVEPTQSGNPDFSLTPGATDSFPDGKAVTVQIGRDSNKPTITATYSGGKGTNQISRIEVTLYRADDKEVITQQFGKEPKIGSELTFEGSSTPSTSDRVKVVAYYYSGEVVVVSDDLYTYKKRS
ncbi:hypothetical protein [Methanocorpusculum vombati]|uniref:Lipoprotein n=1 Tax=Methanocorpusculum vombati TaxID=3002864 RepID=A0ABT4IKT6_9EURY|nr:hypothetical protein [Methanocorpusculum vombati]MCZ9319425.1 hypothetical protein [Methanocorpusculum sp.]MCZ0862141.1 hypothetical protein [Methanocorpusculum vombati]MDE2521115.1 hypothetical protein [Methanocorpusculum sp.]MDE2534778.1 hypothetical protein [Methanocorpusculum sp.]MDE2546387.1 hypothetical protein [Methanocorpusculum sp.]